jgi:hypothetical protein
MTTVYVIAGVAALFLLVAVAIYRLGKANAAPTRSRRVAAPTQGRKALSQRDAVKEIRAGDTFVVNLPGSRHVRIPTPENIAFYVGLALLVAAKLIDWPLAVIGIDWPVALVIGAGHAFARNSDRDRAGEIDELRTEIRRLAEMLPTNGEGDQPPAEVR